MSPSSGSRRQVTIVALLTLIATALIVTAIVVLVTRRQSPPPISSGAVESTQRAIPESIAHISLVNQNGKATDLAAFRGKTVVMADFMTSCQEECPITDGALLAVQNRLRAAHLSNQVEVVEISIDAKRDTPARLLAYQRAFGLHWTMLTGTAANLHRLWSWFGVIYQRVAEGKPPAINWQNGKPYTYDLVHSDAAFVLDGSGTERAVAAGNANVGRTLPKSLAGLLDAQGHQNLVNPGYGSWTPNDMVKAVGVVLGRAISTSG